MYFGADYYPEHWPRERWAKDAKMMREANLNIVRLAEFSWARLEPAKGVYDFSWLDEAIETLSKEDIRTVLGTPTAAPPKWLMDENPGIYMKDVYGNVRGFGSRRHYCFNNPAYHEHTKRIVAAMAGHYKDNTSVVAWQIDNEFGERCYCEHCLAAFKGWLQKKYGALDTLNHEWGTVFWSQTYSSWDELVLPAYTHCYGEEYTHGHNPGMFLDFCRFSSDSIISYQKIQIDEIRKFAGQPVTHNLIGLTSETDYYKLGKDLDFVAWDNYTNNQWGCNPYQMTSMAADQMRGIKNKNVWVMEQQSGPCGWGALGDTPEPGQIRLWTYQSIAHGAEAILYFRWRACTFGTEVYWYGILDHDGIPRRRYDEVRQTGKELDALSDWIAGSNVAADAAIIWSYDNIWSHQLQPHNKNFGYDKLLIDYYNALIKNNLTVDVTSIDIDLSCYKIVFMPAFNLMNDEIKGKVESYVKNGGILVTTFRSGTRTWNNKMTTETLPGDFREMAGIELMEFDSLNNGRQVKVSGATGEGFASVWCDVLKPAGAKILSTYSSHYYSGEAAITLNSFGKGKVFYVGCDLDQDSMKKLVGIITENAGIEPVIPATVDGVEVVRKEKAGKPYLVVLNYNNVPVALDIKKSYTELISGNKVENKLILQPYAVAFLAWEIIDGIRD